MLAAAGVRISAWHKSMSPHRSRSSREATPYPGTFHRIHFGIHMLNSQLELMMQFFGVSAPLPR